MSDVETHGIDPKTRGEFLRDAAFVVGAAGFLLGAGPLAKTAEAQTAPGIPGWLEDQTPGVGAFEYGLPINPYEVSGYPSGSEAGSRRILDLAKDAGANTISVGVWWPTVQPSAAAPPDFAPIDAAVRLAQERGFKVNLYINGIADWVHPTLRNTEPDAGKRVFYVPQTAEELRLYGEFAGKVAARYGTRVVRYKLWNEPNVPNFTRPFTYEQSPAAYARMLRAGYLGIKRAVPDARVVFGGISTNDEYWLQKFYDVAKAYADAAPNRFFFDELDVHPHMKGESPEQRTGFEDSRGTGVLGLARMKAVMDRNGDTGKSIFMGEFGYITVGGYWPKPVPDARRALYLKQAYEQARELAFVSGMQWYAFHPSSSAREGMTMLDANLAPNRTFQAMREAAGWNRSLKVYPKPSADGVISGEWTVVPVWEGGAAPTDVYAYELYVDGEVWAEPGATAPFKFKTWRVSNGQRRIVLAAYTRSGSVYASEPVVLTVRNANQGPQITGPKPYPDQTVSDRTPLIEAYVRDPETELQKANIKMWLDGRVVTGFTYVPSTDRLYYIPPAALAPGRRLVRIEATDAKGLTVSKQWGFYVR